jgi:nucleoside 2-deoxyribosyltransferase
MEPKPTIYLAGPMTGLLEETYYGWRTKARLALEDAGWQVLTPTKGQELPDGENYDADRTEEWRPINRTSSGMVRQDRLYVWRSDAILFNFHPEVVAPVRCKNCGEVADERASIGSAIEFGWADARDKLIVTVLVPETIHDHGFFRRLSGVFVPTLDEALTYLCGIV